MFSKRLITVILCVLFNKSIYSQNSNGSSNEPRVLTWIHITTADKSSWYIKSDYLSKDQEGIKIWTRATNKIRKVGKKTYRNTNELFLYIFNCSTQQIKLQELTCYDGDGNIIISRTLNTYEQKWETVIPGSIGESMLLKSCELFNN